MSGRAVAGVLLGTAILAVAVYLPALPGEFVSDDLLLVVGNPAVRSFDGALRAFGRGYWSGLKEVAPYYRPLVVLSFALDRSVAGLKPAVFHAANILLHAACSVLAALLVLRLAVAGGRGHVRMPFPSISSSALAGAALAGSLAAVHPIHSEPVAAIYGRPDLLCAFFALAFLNLALRGRRLLALLCLAAAMLSKESAVGLALLSPFAFAAGHRSPAGFPARGESLRRSRRALLLGALLGALLIGGYLALRYHALGRLHDPLAVTRLDNPLAAAEPEAQRWTPLAVLAHYAGQWLWPARLCADWGFDVVPLAERILEPRVLAGGAVLLVFLLGTAHLALRRSSWALIAAAAGLAYLPASNLFFLAPALAAERFLYLPSLGACVLLGGAWARVVPSPDREGGRARGWPFGTWGLHAAALAIVLLAGARTLVRAGEFRDDLTLYESSAAACPRSAKAQYNLGNALARANREADAIRAYEAAVGVAPWLAIAHTNMGNVYLNLRRLEDAEDAYRRAIEASPALLFPHVSLAGVLYLQGDLEEALREAQAALALGPAPQEAEQIGELIRRITKDLAERRPAGR